MLMQKGRIPLEPPVRYLTSESNDRHRIHQINHEKDLGITFNQTLRFDEHISNIVKKANRNMGIIRRSFDMLTPEVFVPLYTALVRSHLEYGQAVWSPYLQQDINRLESVQRNATKQLNGFKNMPYTARLRALKLPTLAYRRLRGDMIEAYKLLAKVYDPTASIHLARNTAGRRGNDLKLYVEGGVNSNLRKHFFRHRVVKHWNSLPNHVVLSTSVNMFKNRLDKHWEHHPLKYDPQGLLD
jgi:hypothetical protein